MATISTYYKVVWRRSTSDNALLALPSLPPATGCATERPRLLDDRPVAPPSRLTIAPSHPPPKPSKPTIALSATPLRPRECARSRRTFLSLVLVFFEGEESHARIPVDDDGRDEGTFTVPVMLDSTTCTGLTGSHRLTLRLALETASGQVSLALELVVVLRCGEEEGGGGVGSPCGDKTDCAGDLTCGENGRCEDAQGGGEDTDRSCEDLARVQMECKESLGQGGRPFSEYVAGCHRMGWDSRPDCLDCVVDVAYCDPICDLDEAGSPQAEAGTNDVCVPVGHCWWLGRCLEPPNFVPCGDQAEQTVEYRGRQWQACPAPEHVSYVPDPGVNTDPGKLYFPEAVAYCEDLDLAGHQDWRLPSVDELRSLVAGCPHSVDGHPRSRFSGLAG